MNDIERENKARDDVLTCRQALFLLILGITFGLSIALLGRELLGKSAHVAQNDESTPNESTSSNEAVANRAAKSLN